MSVAEENLPDNYFSDLDANSKYYCDVLLAVEVPSRILRTFPTAS